MEDIEKQTSMLVIGGSFMVMMLAGATAGITFAPILFLEGGQHSNSHSLLISAIGGGIGAIAGAICALIVANKYLPKKSPPANSDSE